MAPAKGKNPKEMKVASFASPDDFIQGGLPTDFDGVAEKFRLVPWNYAGKREEYSLAVRVDLVPDEDSGQDPFSAFLSAGNLKHFVPSTDGINPAGGSVDDYLQLASGEADTDPDNPEQYEGVYFLQISKEEKLSRGSNFFQFYEALRDCEGFPVELLGADLSKLDGIYGHWNRVPQRKRDGLSSGDESGRTREILVMTEYKGKKGANTSTSRGKSAGPGSTTSKSVANGADNTDLEERLEEVISSALSTEEAQAKLNDDGELPKKQIPPLILASIKPWPNSEKSAAVAMSTKPEFLGADGRPWIYNEDRGTLTPIG